MLATIHWRRVGPAYAIGFALAAVCEFGASHIPFVDSVTWPGITAAFATMLVFRTSFFAHPHIFAWVAIFFNGLLYGLILWTLIALSSRARRFRYNRP